MAIANDIKMRILAEDKTAAAFRSANSGLARMQKAAAAAKMAFVAITASIVAIGAAAKKFSAAADDIAKFSKRTGISTDALQELGFAATQSGVSAEAFNKAIINMVKNFSDAAEGTGEAYDEIKRLGIVLKDANGQLRPAEDLMMDLADAMQGVTNDTEKLAIATKIFGGRGSVMVQMLENGSVGMNKLREEARRLGIIMDQETLANAEKVTDEFDKMSRIVSSNLTAALVDLAPVLTRITEGLAGAAKAVRGFIDPLEKYQTPEGKLEAISGWIDSVRDRIDELKVGMEGGRRSFLDVFFGTTYEEAQAEIASLEARLVQYKKMQDELIAKISTPVTIVSDKNKEKAMPSWFMGAKQALDEYEKKATDTFEAAKSAAAKSFKAMEDSLVEFVTTGKMTFSGFIDSIIADITRMAVQKSITKPLYNMLFDIGGSMLGDFSTPTPTPRALGGPVFAGAPYMVGERGPELFVPSSSGSIIPNNKLPEGGGSVTINMNVSGVKDEGTLQRSAGRVAADAARAVRRARRNM